MDEQETEKRVNSVTVIAILGHYLGFIYFGGQILPSVDKEQLIAFR